MGVFSEQCDSMAILNTKEGLQTRGGGTDRIWD